jgi:hypothetical protein
MGKAASAAGVDPYELKPEGGESFPELIKIIRTFFDALIKKKNMIKQY